MFLLSASRRIASLGAAHRAVATSSSSARSVVASFSSSSPLSFSSSASSSPASSSNVGSGVWERLDDPTRQLADQILACTNSSGDGGDEEPPWKLRLALSKAITLAESRNPSRQNQAALLLTHLLHEDTALERRRQSFRVGIAGAPGAGKSTFIEAFGNYILKLSEGENSGTTSVQDVKEDSKEKGVGGLWVPEKLAVVCVDPSGKSGGSILGDKTRMTELSRHPRAYVRPAPAAGALGGLATYTDDVVSLCQVADYGLVVVETVGLGQSEIEVEQTVDMLLLLVPPAGGDDLQGVKKGIVEVCDMLMITKADGNLLHAAKKTASDYKGAMQFLRTFGPTTPLKGWERPKVKLVSSVTKDGLDVVWKKVCDFRKKAMESGFLEAKRREQRRYWMWKNLQNLVQLETDVNPVLQEKAKHLEAELVSGRMTSRVAAAELLECLQQNKSSVLQ